MLKLLLLALAIWLVVSFLQRHRRSAEAAAQPETKAANMVRCDTCGVHLPEAEAILCEDRHYCCTAHLPPSRE